MKVAHLLENFDEWMKKQGQKAPANEVDEMVEYLNSETSVVDLADREDYDVHIDTKGGDKITIRHNPKDGQWYAFVQGQKRDIECGQVGKNPDQVLDFVKALNEEGEEWYKENDPDWDE